MILHAKYLLSSSNELIENGAVRVVGSEIADVGNFDSVKHGKTDEIRDFGDAVILPGFVNAHTHLELTNLHGRVERTDSLPDWLMGLMSYRGRVPGWLRRVLRQVGYRYWGRKLVERSTAKGIAMSLAGGATTVADITNSGWSVSPLKRNPIRKLVFYEAIGFDTKHLSHLVTNISAKLNATQPDSLLNIGISPHAPYSVSAELYRECVKIAQERNLHLCTHLAETQEELEFLSSGTGAFFDMLTKLGISVADWQPPNQTPVEYMHALGVLECRPLLAHCNYLTASDIQLLQNSNANVVFCPRSHNYFHHRSHPFEKLLHAGVTVALGTDSLVSNDSLSMLDELKFLHCTQNHIPPEKLLEMAALQGAHALQLDTSIGALRRDWQADIIAVEIPVGQEHPTERILADESRVVFTMVAGITCYNLNQNLSGIAQIKYCQV